MANPDIKTQLYAAIKSHREGDLITARELYENILKEDSHNLAALFNLGILLLAQQAITEAAHVFEQLLAIDPNNLAAHYHLANCYFRTEKFSLAQKQYEHVLNIQPNHLDALNNLGALLLHENQPEQALQCFTTALIINPKHHEARNNLAAALLQQQRYAQAAENYRLLLEQTPNDIGARYSYGVALLESDDYNEAINQFKIVLSQQPDHNDAQNNLGIAYLKAGKFPEAQDSFEIALEQNPNNLNIQYLYAALTGQQQPATPPEEYIKDLFDHYARRYEKHLVDTLHYQVPNQLYQLLIRTIHKPITGWHILDLGCGTGLSGVPFRQIASSLIGVDLSPKMLLLAKHKNIYNNLIEDNLLHTLQQHPEEFDLLLAADTFNYFGDFTELFTACYNSLKTNGYLLFSTEEAPENITPWRLQQSCRYAHAQNYIETLASQLHFEKLIIEKAILRTQNNQPVKGLLFLFKKH